MNKRKPLQSGLTKGEKVSKILVITNLNKQVLLLMALLVIGSALVSEPHGETHGEDSYRPPQLKRPVSLIVPLQIRHLSHAWERGHLRLRIGPEGKVEDWVALYLPHRKLLPAVERALEGARFIPALVEGEPAKVDVVATLPLSEAGSFEVINQTTSEHIESRMAHVSIPGNALILSSPAELDGPLEIVERGKVYSVTDEEGRELNWRVTMEFYVDQEGTVRMPRPAEAVDPVVAEAAMRTVRGFRFIPPRREGKPTVVKARIQLVGDGK